MKSSTPAFWFFLIIVGTLLFLAIDFAFQSGWLHQRHPLTLQIHHLINSPIQHA